MTKHVQRCMSCISVGMAVFFFAVPVFAITHAAAIQTNPSSGSFSEPFTVDVMVNGSAKSFNAAQATVTLSSNLVLSDLVYGDCNFSFVTTPSVSSPSFAGVILGGSSKQCTVYTMTVTPTSAGQGTITFTKGSVKEIYTASELIASVKNGTYTLTGSGTSGITVTPTSSETDTKDIPAYSLNVKVASGGSPNSRTNVVLSPQGEGSTRSLQVATDSEGVAHLSDVPPGTYVLSVHENGRKVTEKVINVAGNQQVLTFGVHKEKGQKLDPLMLTAVIVIGFVILLFSLSWFFRQKKKKS